MSTRASAICAQGETAIPSQPSLSNPVVIDSNIAVKYALPAVSQHRMCRQFISFCMTGGIEIVVPRLFEAECDGVLLGMYAQGQISEAAAAIAQNYIDLLPVTVKYKSTMRLRAREIARQAHQTRCYDATYAALAEALGYDFWTADRAFYDAVHPDLPFVHFITEFTL